MVTNLDVLFQEVVSEEGETEGIFALLEQFASIDVLLVRNMDVTISKVVIKAVADEDGAEVEQKPEFFIRDFQMNGRVTASGGVEIAFGKAGVLGYIIDDGVGDDDVVIYEGEAGGEAAAAAEDGETADSGAGGPDDVFGLGVRDFDFFALEDDEFGVDGYVGAWQDVFFVRGESVGVAEMASVVSMNLQDS